MRLFTYFYLIRKTILMFFGTLFLSLGLVACSTQDYPQGIKNDLMALCMDGVLSGQTVVASEHFEAKNVKQALKLCEFRLNAFIKEVNLQDYQQHELHIYENFVRAFGHKYVLGDIFKTLSDRDRRVFEQISRIMLGLDTNTTDATDAAPMASNTSENLAQTASPIAPVIPTPENQQNPAQAQATTDQSNDLAQYSLNDQQKAITLCMRVEYVKFYQQDPPMQDVMPTCQRRFEQLVEQLPFSKYQQYFLQTPYTAYPDAEHSRVLQQYAQIMMGEVSH